VRTSALVLLGLILIAFTWHWRPAEEPVPPSTLTPRSDNALKVGIRWLDTEQVVFHRYSDGGDAGWSLEGRLVDDGTCAPHGTEPMFRFSGRLPSGMGMGRRLEHLVGDPLHAIGPRRAEWDRAEVCAPRALDRLLVETDLNIALIAVEDNVALIRILATFEPVEPPRHPIPVEGVLKARISE
jgi:hypothetical protein